MTEPEKQISNIISNPRYAGLFLLLMANGQMGVEDIVKYVCSLRGGKKLLDIQNLKLDLSSYMIEGCPRLPLVSPTYQGQEYQEQEQTYGGFKDEYLCTLTQKFQSFQGGSNGNNFKFDTGIRKLTIETLNLCKKDSINSAFQQQKGHDKIAYMKALMNKIVEQLGRDPVQAVADKIVKQGSINSSICHAIFSDITFRQKVENLIKNCQTFKELKKYNCQDINKSKKEIQLQIYSIIVQYDIPEEQGQKICIQLEKNPQSNIVASSPHLTVATKKKFYQSSLYQKESLRKYAQLNHYSQSLIYSAREQCREILDLINQVAKISEDVIKKVLNFQFFDLLKTSSIAQIKKDLFGKIIKCDSYLKVFKKIKYQKKTIQGLSQDQLINISFSLKKLFLKINLPFQAWEQAQKKLLSKKFQYISELQLSLQGYNQLVTFIFERIQKYYHEQEKQMSYRDEIFFHILSLLMQADLADDMKFDKIFKIATETISSQQFYCEDVDQLGKGVIKEYKTSIITDEKFLEFKNNQRQDIKQEKYNKVNQIRKHIYEINKKNKAKISFDAIEAFIKKIVEEGDGEVPQEYPLYITDLKQLHKKLNPSDDNEEEEEQGKVVAVKKKVEEKVPQKKKGKLNPEELKKQFQQWATSFVKDYTKNQEDSRFQKGLTEKFSNDGAAYMKRIIQTNALNNPDSIFFAELAYNGPITKQFKKQFSEIGEKYSANMKRAVQINTLLSGQNQAETSPSKSTSQKEENSPTKSKQPKGVDKGQLEAEFASLSSQFVNQYTSKNEDSYLEKAYERYGKDATKFVRDIIQKSALTNKQSPFFSSLGMNAVLTKKTKAEFQQNAASINEKLKRCIQIQALLK